MARENATIYGLPSIGMTRSPSLAEQAADAIVAGIASGALKPGQRLIETELAAFLSMSRVPLREALKILEAQGIVESIQHRGTSVAKFDEHRIRNICEARIALERIAVRQAAERYRTEPSLLDGLDRLITAMERAAARLEWIDVSKADLGFHREICRVSGNEIVQTLWETLARHVLIIFGHEIRDERDAATVAQHHRVLRDLLAAGDTAALDSEIGHHISRLQERVDLSRSFPERISA